jgi:hypothetical protein
VLASGRKAKSLQHQQSTVGSTNDIGLTDTELAAAKPLLSTALICDRRPRLKQPNASRIGSMSTQRTRAFGMGEVMPGVGPVFSRNHQGVNERYLIDAPELLSL